MNTDPDRLIDQLKTVSVWKRGSQRAPHKPLLLLLTLAAVKRGESRLLPYSTIHEQLSRLLIDFGPPRQSVHPEYPFWRLQNDGDFWEIPQREEAVRERGDRPRSGDVPSSILSHVEAAGGFREPLYNALRTAPETIDGLAQNILEEHFPSSIHEGILNAVGMPELTIVSRAERSPEFRATVLRLYEHRCAICGFDGQLDRAPFGLEAAHIMWHALGGPSEAGNGLLLCSIHHKALDLGAIGLTGDHRLLVSQHVRGGDQVTHLITGLAGRPVQAPIDPGATPGKRYMDWHRKEVFKGPARPPPPRL